MKSEVERFTIQSAFSLLGNGLHSGKPCSLSVMPGDDGYWLESANGSQRASASAVTSTLRSTSTSLIATVEHVLSGLAGSGITDARIFVDGDEMPAMDGSSALVVREVERSGRKRLGSLQVDLFERVFLVLGEAKVAVSKGSGHWRYVFDCGDRWPRQQVWEGTVTSEVYRDQISGARTFAFEEEVVPLRQAGLGKGLDAESCLVIGTTGYLNDPRFSDEPVRHKVLDLIGDLALSGIPPGCIDVVAEKSGHTANVAAALKLLKHARITRT